MYADSDPTTIEEAVAPLFEPVQITPGLSLPNRVVLAPMGVGQAPGGIPNETLRNFYARRARHGVGLVITSATFIDHPSASNHTLLPSISGRAAIDSWRRIADAVHENGGNIFMQLMHAGGDREAETSLEPFTTNSSPSGYDGAGTPRGEPMTGHEVRDTIDAFARSAETARTIGFDGVEIHGAHGFLIDQFLWGTTNRRSDAYAVGARYAAETVGATRRAVGPDFPISFRMSQWKTHNYAAKIAQNTAELWELVGVLDHAGVDVFHASTRRFWAPEFEGSSLGLAGWIKQLTGKPTIAVGSVGLNGPDFHSVFQGEGAQAADLTALVGRLKAKEFDLIAVGRALLGDPEWLDKVREGRTSELRPFEARSLFELR